MLLLSNIEYFKVQKNGLSPFQNLVAYLGGSAFQTILDNPVTAYRQLVQQYAKGLDGKVVDPKIATKQANEVFKKNPVSASLSGVIPRLVGVGFKRVPKFFILLGVPYIQGEKEVGFLAATIASIMSAPFINPIRMIEKQQRAFLKQTGQVKPIAEILRESASKNFSPLFRGTVPLMGHSLVSATLGLVGQPRLQKYIENKVSTTTTIGKVGANLIASTVVSPIYVAFTNPLSRLEVIMQTSSIKGKSISVMAAMSEVIQDSKKFGIRGIFRGQGIGIFKAIISLSLFHEGRLFLSKQFKQYNEDHSLIPS